MTANAPCDVHKALKSKSFRASLSSAVQPQMEISGFGVRVPGGAPASRLRQTSQSVPGPFCLPPSLLRPSSDRDCASHHKASHRCRPSGFGTPPSVEPPTITPVGGMTWRSHRPLGSWGEISTWITKTDARGKPIKHKSQAKFRDHDGHVRQVSAYGKNKNATERSLLTKLQPAVSEGNIGESWVSVLNFSGSMYPTIARSAAIENQDQRIQDCRGRLDWSRPRACRTCRGTTRVSTNLLTAASSESGSARSRSAKLRLICLAPFQSQPLLDGRIWLVIGGVLARLGTRRPPSARALAVAAGGPTARMGVVWLTSTGDGPAPPRSPVPTKRSRPPALGVSVAELPQPAP
jgi:hypothetical protein